MTRDEIDEERQRRRTMAELKEALYGEKMGPYATDPDWDDVVPVSSDEPEGSLAAIAYPEHYAEIISYLRAVMAAEEHSPRTLRLTEHFAWLNGVSLDHLKNYQIWHHRQLLLDHVHARIGSDATAVKKLAHDESHFLRLILAEDTKNYHVWSYRQYLVRRLGLWTAQELAATQTLIEDDVRNNSAWSHRFFVNQAPWNYLRGVLVKGGRPLASVESTAVEYVWRVGEADGEDVRSSHALDFLADVHAEKGETDEAATHENDGLLKMINVM
ncbi:Malic acid transport protein [Verticillium dahliae VDG2]|nr:Malic acid transport protein [Verticillium dahliae VDG2]